MKNTNKGEVKNLAAGLAGANEGKVARVQRRALYSVRVNPEIRGKQIIIKSLGMALVCLWSLSRRHASQRQVAHSTACIGKYWEGIGRVLGKYW